MNKTKQQSKLSLNREVVIKLKQSSNLMGKVNEKERMNWTCCDGLSYATTPYM